MLVLFNADVITMNPTQPRAELVAVEGERIVSVGDNRLLKSLERKATMSIDCGGRTLLPGFIDAHCHIHAYAESLVSLDLSPCSGANSISDIQHKIRKLCNIRPRGAWIKGKAYNEFFLAEKRHPNRWDLDEAASSHPVKLTHRSGHAHVLNSRALNLVGITEEMGDPPGGLIDRDIKSGKPTGILYGMGRYLAGRVPPTENSVLEKGLALANQTLISYGITSIRDATSHNDLRQWRRFETWKKQGIIQPRLSMAIGFDNFIRSGSRRPASDIPESDLKLGGVKIIAGRITGDLHPDQKNLNEMVAAIHQSGLQALIHAVEEPVVEAACRAIEYASTCHPGRDHRHRIEHCSVCSLPLLKRIEKLKIAVVTQPSFLYSGGDRYMETVPSELLENLYPIGSMIKHGLLVGAGSDIPVGNANPMIGIYAAVTRNSESGDSTLPGSRASAYHAVKMYTSNAAFTNFEENIKGSLRPGKLADLVILDADPLAIDPDPIKDIRVVMTLIGGRVVYSDNSLLERDQKKQPIPAPRIP